MMLVSVALFGVSIEAFASITPFAVPALVSSSPTSLPSRTISLLATLKDVNIDGKFNKYNHDNTMSSVSRRSALSGLVALTAAVPSLLPTPANARLEGVNKPELLPSEPGLNVIQVEKFLTKGQEKRMNDLLTKLEKDTGYRVRVLCQAYPQTPG